MNFKTTITGDNYPTSESDVQQAVVGYVKQQLESFSVGREEVELSWVDCWALYCPTPESIEWLRSQVLRTVGNVENEWRHKISVGKAFEIVETIHGYLMAAFFPNSKWFDVVPKMPGYSEIARIVKGYISDKLEEWMFYPAFESYLRQLIITGVSCLSLPWANDEIEFECLDIFDIYLDPNATNPQKSDFIRKIKLSRADVINSNLYEIDELDVVTYHNDDIVYDNEARLIREFHGLDVDTAYSMRDMLTLYEYWGDIHLDGVTYHNVVATVLGSELVRWEPNSYKCGKPFIYSTLIPLVRQPYALGAIKPAAGLLHQLDIITNQRLDNVELTINSMWTLVRNGITNPADVFSQPGRVLEVKDHNDLRPLASPNAQNITISYTEANTLQANIENLTGTGPLISTSQPRGGERVTAEEISSVRQAGGNRLSNIHLHIERCDLNPMLNKLLLIIQQFVRKDDIIRIAGSRAGEYNYYNVGPDELQLQFKMKAVGASHILEQNEYVKRRIDLIKFFSSIPQIAEILDYTAVAIDMLRNWGIEDPEAYIKKQDKQQSEIEQLGGAPLKQLTTESLALDGGASLLSKLYDTNVQPEDAHAALQGLEASNQFLENING